MATTKTGLTLVADKYYVLDTFEGPVEGPFDTWSEAETIRRQLNIDGDCVVVKCVKNELLRKWQMVAVEN